MLKVILTIVFIILFLNFLYLLIAWIKYKKEQRFGATPILKMDGEINDT